MLFHPPSKSFAAERAVRYTKGRIFKAMAALNTNNWTEILQFVVKAMNGTPSRIINAKPSQVNQSNERFIYRQLYNDILPTTKKPKFKVNSLVRIALSSLNPFEKESHRLKQSFSTELFIIETVVSSKIGSRPVFKLRDLNWDKIKSIFYDHELLLVTLAPIRDGYQFISILPLGNTNDQERIEFSLVYKSGKKEIIITGNKDKIYKLASNE